MTGYVIDGPGGDEFLVVLRSTSKDEIRQLAHWLQLISSPEAHALGAEIEGSLNGLFEVQVD